MSRLSTGGWLGVAGVVVLLATASLPQAERSSPALRAVTATDEPVALSNDVGGGAVFALENLAPGHPETNCVLVSHQNARTGKSVSLYAQITDPGLADYLDLKVEAGHGGGYGSCNGFTPAAELYDGTLAGFAAEHHDTASGVAAMSIDEADGSATFRLTAELQDKPEAQDKRAEFDLIWSAPGRTPASTPAPTASSPQPSITTDAVPTPPATVDDSGGGGGEEEQGDKSMLEKIADAVVDAVAEVVRRYGVPVAKATSVGAFAGLLVAAFLLIQHRIDRADPKLALAPVRPPEHLIFVDRSEFS